MQQNLRRRTLLPLVGSALLCSTVHSPLCATRKVTLASEPIDVQGEWGDSLPHSALLVVSRMREVCLRGVRLVSDRQPEWLRVDNHTKGPPHIWLHYDGAPFAWIIVDIGPRDWSKLAYQFGHEFGHVLCNLWREEARRSAEAKRPTSCAWLEEVLVEAFSIRGLGRLADSWARDPPFPGNAAFAGAIRQYRDDLLTKYRTVATEQGATINLAAWFRIYRDALGADGDIGGPARGAVLAVLAELMADPAAVEGMGALNRWPELSGVPIEDYLRLWKQSCADLGASQRLPVRLRTLLLGG